MQWWCMYQYKNDPPIRLQTVIQLKISSLATERKHASNIALSYESSQFRQNRPVHSTELQVFHNNFSTEKNNNNRCTKNVYSHHIKPSASNKTEGPRHWPHISLLSPTYIRINFTSTETRMIVLPDIENRTIISSFVWTKHRNVMDRQTDLPWQ